MLCIKMFKHLSNVKRLKSEGLKEDTKEFVYSHRPYFPMKPYLEITEHHFKHEQ